MTQQVDRPRPSPQRSWAAVSVAFFVLMLCGASFYAAQTLSRDDCTTVTTRMSDGSQVATKTCS